MRRVEDAHAQRRLRSDEGSPRPRRHDRRALRASSRFVARLFTSRAGVSKCGGIVTIDLTGQVVIVTGAGRGIGETTAKMAAAAGARVMLVARSEGELHRVADEIRGAGGEALAQAIDLTDPSAAKAITKATLEAWDRIDVLVNNAGTNSIASLIMAKEQAYRDVYELNLFAVVKLTQAVLRPMIRQKSGRVINVSSVSAKLGAAYNSAYASSKAAVLGFTKSVARETAKIGITVNAICPWHVDTALVRESMANRAKMFGKNADEYLQEIISHSPQGRLITCEEVGGLALFLMSEPARGITGQAINVCGGSVMD
jgi:NAD(P)-dependent dehydrogenase (short-subunit alcohol dehydrogenase family)